MANYIQGNLKEEYHVYQYTGLESTTARVEVDNDEQTIAVDVLFGNEDAEKILEKAEEITNRFDNLSSTATVDSAVGTPSVDVDLQLVDDSYNINFDFHNLKGEQGIQGIQGKQGIQGEQGVGITSINITEKSTSGLDVTYTLTATKTDGTTTASDFTVTNGTASADGIKYSEQNLTNEQQTQARKNLGIYASEITDTSGVGIDVTWDGNLEVLDKIEIYNADDDYTATYYKISDIVPDLSDTSQYYMSNANDPTAEIESTKIEFGVSKSEQVTIGINNLYDGTSSGILGICKYEAPEASDWCDILLIDNSNQEYEAGIYFGYYADYADPDEPYITFVSALHLASAPWSNVAENVYNPINSKFTSAISYAEEQKLTNEQKMRARINQGLYAEGTVTQPYSISISNDSIEYMNESLRWSTDSSSPQVYKLSSDVPFDPEQYLGQIISIDIISEGVNVTQASNAPYFSIGSMMSVATSGYMLSPSTSSESSLGDILFATQNYVNFEGADWEKGIYFIQSDSNKVALPTLLDAQGSFDASFNGITVAINSILNPIDSKFTQAISYSEIQSLTEDQKMRARENQGLYGSITEKFSEVKYVAEGDLSSFPMVNNDQYYWYRIGDIPTDDLTKIDGISEWSNVYDTCNPNPSATLVFSQENARGYNNKRINNNNDVQIIVVPVSTTVTISSYGTFNFTSGVWINSAYSHDARQPADKILTFTLLGDFSTTTTTKIPSQYLEYPPLLIDVESVETTNAGTITTYDKTYKEIYDAYNSGRRVVLLNQPNAIIVELFNEYENDYAAVGFVFPYLDSANNYSIAWNEIQLFSRTDINTKLITETVNTGGGEISQ